MYVDVCGRWCRLYGNLDGIDSGVIGRISDVYYIVIVLVYFVGLCVGIWVVLCVNGFGVFGVENEWLFFVDCGVVI